MKGSEEKKWRREKEKKMEMKKKLQKRWDYGDYYDEELGEIRER